MTPERWRQVEEMLHAALSRGESERAAFLGHACAGDAALRREVELLLAQQASMGGFLEDQPVATAAPLFSESGASVLTGRRLGVYQVHARIGAGGMGEVYRARDTRLGRDVAIKILPRHFISDPDRLARFEREARVLASLNHPGRAVRSVGERCRVVHQRAMGLRARLLRYRRRLRLRLHRH
jgi:serine/threonine protein kinase